MANEIAQPVEGDPVVQEFRTELAKHATGRKRRISEKFVLAALSAVPWVGGFMAAAASIDSTEKDAAADDIRTRWLEEHQKKLHGLSETLNTINDRFENLGPDIDERIESPEYLSLVRQAFRTWDQAESDEKRKYVANLLSNCAGTRLSSDDVIRLFIKWINEFHESHFAVIREVYQNPGSTRFDIWGGIRGEGILPRDDSADADLYKMLIRDLSTSGVVRQARDATEAGQWVRKRAPRRRTAASTVMKSAFDDNEQYVLTELGKQFVHYTLIATPARLGA